MLELNKKNPEKLVFSMLPTFHLSLHHTLSFQGVNKYLSQTHTVI